MGAVYAALGKFPIDAANSQGQSLASISWVPYGVVAGGLTRVNDAVLDNWTHPTLCPEIWTFGIVRDAPAKGTGTVPMVILSGQYTKKIQVPSGAVSRVGKSGPYIALAVGVPGARGAYPTYRRVVLQSIVAENCPVPVESSYERDVVLLLQSHKIEFIKPVFDDEFGLRPDFRLYKRKEILEVQGMNRAGYREHKAEMHQRMLDSPGYRGYTLVRYDPNARENLDTLRARLRLT